jgi:hypothetical protein
MNHSVLSIKCWTLVAQMSVEIAYCTVTYECIVLLEFVFS